MTIPLTIPFGRWRLVFSLNLISPSPTPATPARAKTVAPRRPPTRFPEAYDATDGELARFNQRAAAEADRRRWQELSIMHGLRG